MELSQVGFAIIHLVLAIPIHSLVLNCHVNLTFLFGFGVFESTYRKYFTILPQGLILHTYLTMTYIASCYLGKASCSRDMTWQKLTQTLELRIPRHTPCHTNMHGCTPHMSCFYQVLGKLWNPCLVLPFLNSV